MRFKKIEVIVVKELSVWWAKTPPLMRKDILFVNHAQRPRLKYMLKRGAL